MIVRWMLFYNVLRLNRSRFCAAFSGVSSITPIRIMSSSRASPKLRSVPEDVSKLISDLYAQESPPQLYLCTTGGGQAVSWLMNVSGASRCLQEVTVPYSFSAGEHWLKSGHKTISRCSMEASIALAREAYTRALKFTISERGLFKETANQALGVACTASLVSTRPKKGEHRCHIAACDEKGVRCYSMTLSKGMRDRSGEDEIVSRLILRVIFESAGMDIPQSFMKKGLLLIDEKSPEKSEIIPIPKFIPNANPLEELMAGRVNKAIVLASKNDSAEVAMYADLPIPIPTLVFPGSFNPLHEGHLGLVRAAQCCYTRISEDREKSAENVDLPVLFELSIANADKGLLPKEEVMRRISQFSSTLGNGSKNRHAIAITRAPLFLEKARLFPGCIFVVGVDTVRRILTPRYYGNESEMIAALAELKYLGCSIIVGGRAHILDADKKFEMLDDVLQESPLPESLRTMFRGLKEEDFRMDISSTELRAAAAAPASDAGL